MKKIVLTGGGTAGHVTPNLALLPALKEHGLSLIHISATASFLPADQIPIHFYGVKKFTKNAELFLQNEIRWKWICCQKPCHAKNRS